MRGGRRICGAKPSPFWLRLQLCSHVTSRNGRHERPPASTQTRGLESRGEAASTITLSFAPLRIRNVMLANVSCISCGVRPRSGRSGDGAAGAGIGVTLAPARVGATSVSCMRWLGSRHLRKCSKTCMVVQRQKPDQVFAPVVAHAAIAMLRAHLDDGHPRLAARRQTPLRRRTPPATRKREAQTPARQKPARQLAGGL